jgi:predicted nucleic acid-binding protein
VLQQKDEHAAYRAVAFLRHGRIVELDSDLAVGAATLGQELGLPLADSVIYATARAEGATVWTQDEDFEGLEGVRYVPKS